MCVFFLQRETTSITYSHPWMMNVFQKGYSFGGNKTLIEKGVDSQGQNLLLQHRNLFLEELNLSFKKRSP